MGRQADRPQGPTINRERLIGLSFAVRQRQGLRPHLFRHYLRALPMVRRQVSRADLQIIPQALAATLLIVFASMLFDFICQPTKEHADYRQRRTAH